MTILAQDNFDSDTAGQIAPGWVAKVGTWSVGAVRPISGTQTFNASSNNDGDIALYTGVAAMANMDISYAMKQTLATGPLMGPILRSDAANSNQYAFVFSGSTATTCRVLFFKKVSGTFSQIGSAASFAMPQAVGDSIYIRARIIGSTIDLFIGNGALPSSPSATFTDSSITGAGYAGLYNGKDAQGSDMRIDNFVLDDTAAAADTTPPTFVSALVANASSTLLQVTMSEALAASIPPNSAWTATGSSSGTRGPSSGAISGLVSQLTFAVPFVAGETITISYIQPGANPRLQDSASTPNITASFGPSAVTNNVSGTVNNALTGATGNVLFSPYNWDIQVSTAKTINAGAYLKFLFGGTSCTLNFDMTGLVAPLPQFTYQVDRHGPIYSQEVAASVVLNIPSDTSDYATKPGHFVELRVKSMTETQARWSTQATAVKLTGIILDTGKTISAPPALPLKAIFYGDSITEGVRTVNSTATNDTDRNDSGQAWSLEVGRILGAEVGNVGFGATGFNVSGSGGVPALTSSYNFLYSGVARSFAQSPDFIVLMEGTNDGSDVTTSATTVLNGLIAATTAKIIVLRPFGSTAHASQLQAAIAATTTPLRCTYVDTAGFFTVGNSSDNLHPYGVENLSHIAPLVANAIRPILAGAAATTSRTVTMTLRNADGSLAANLSGIQVSTVDNPLRPAGEIVRYQSTTQTTNASGVLSFPYQSTLASGGTCGVDIVMPSDKRNMAVSVVVA